MSNRDPDATEPGEGHAAPSAGGMVGRYRIDGVLGRGGMGTVFRGHDPDLDRPVAIKVLHADLAGARRRLLKEGQAVARLRHPNVITVHDVGVDGDALFIAMELVEGGTLRDYLQARPRTTREIVSLFVAAGRGLAAAHAAGLVHRDFKPDNVLIGDDGRVVVGDFGLAQEGATDTWPAPFAPGGADPALTAGISGTPAYMAPEQSRGEPVDARSDQFSFCVSLWEALHGSRPSPDGPRLRGAVPARIHAALLRGLSSSPAVRFPSMRALLAELQPRSRRPLVVGVLAAAAALAAVAAILLTRPDGNRLVHADAGTCASVYTPIDLADGVPYVDWLRQYQSALALSNRAVCVGDAIRGSPRDDLRTCLDEGASDLRDAAARPAGKSVPWPFLRSLRACVGPIAERHSLAQPAAMGEGFRLSPDTKRILAWRTGAAPVLAIRDRETGTEQLRLPAAKPLRWLDDERIALHRDGVVIVRSSRSGNVVEEYHVEGTVLDVAPDLRRAVVSGPGGVRLVDLRAGTAVQLLDADKASARVSPDGRRVALVDPIRDMIVVHEIATGRRVELAVPPVGQFGKAQLGWLGSDALVIGSALTRGTDGWLARLRLGPNLEPAVPEPLVGAGTMASFAVESAQDSHVLISRVVVDARLELRTADHVEPAPSTLALGRIAWAADDGSRLLVRIADDWSYITLPGWQVAELPLSVADRASIAWAQGEGARTVGIMNREGGPVYFELDGELRTRPLPASLAAMAPRVRCRGAACVVFGATEHVVEIARVTPDGFEPVARVEPEGGLPGAWVRSLDITRDGRRIIVTTPAFRAFLVEAGKATREFRDGSCPLLMLARFVFDARSIVYTCKGADYALRRQDLDSGVTTTVLSDSSTETVTFEPLPDGAIVLSQQTRAGSLELVDVTP